MSSNDTHSNEYAKGSLSMQTFNQRVEVGRRRRTVGSYRSSRLGQTYVDPSMRKRRYEQQSRTPDGAGISAPTRQETNAGGVATTKSSVPPRQSFNEPQSRSYNPYA